MAETLEELEKKREDIKTLLKTLEEAYNDASITEEHYKEVKEKNEKSLQEIEKKINEMSSKAGETSRKGGRPKKEEKKPKTVGEMIAAEMEIPVSQPVEEESIAGIEIGKEKKEKFEEKPSETLPVGKPSETLSVKDLQDVLQKFVKELRPETSGIGEKLEKLAIQFEKLRTFVDAIKDEKTDTEENIRRIMEEIGELRSGVNSLESRMSEQEIKMEEAISTMKYLKTDQFVRDLQRKETEIKTHEARLDKIDDMLSMLIKKVTTIEDAFKDLGSLENVARFSQGLAAKIKEIDDREAKITKLADRVNSIFIELNKRLEEFMFYKVKQQTLDELSQETMKSLEEINTKIEGFASKEDLEMLRNTVEQRIAEVASSGGAGNAVSSKSPKLRQLETQREEIEGLLAMLDEQLASKKISKADYEKTKKINTKRLEDIEKQIMAEETAAAGKASPSASETGPEDEKTKKPEEPEAMKNDKTKPSEKPGQAVSGKPEPGKMQPGPKPVPEASEEKGKPDDAKKDMPKENAIAEKKPASSEPVATKTRPAGHPQNHGMLQALENSFRKGLISREAYEKTRKMLGFGA